jgi:hypothetical protein
VEALELGVAGWCIAVLHVAALRFTVFGGLARRLSLLGAMGAFGVAALAALGACRLVAPGTDATLVVLAGFVSGHLVLARIAPEAEAPPSEERTPEAAAEADRVLDARDAGARA